VAGAVGVAVPGVVVGVGVFQYSRGVVVMVGVRVADGVIILVGVLVTVGVVGVVKYLGSYPLKTTRSIYKSGAGNNQGTAVSGRGKSNLME